MTTTAREGLTRPLSPEDIEWRPGSAKWDHKDACQGPKCREAKDPTKHMQLAYVGDETVMDRLDEGFGTGNWQLLTEAVADGVVKVRLGVTYDLEHWVWFEDFGYANRHDGDVLKEAVTDGIRRCGRFVIPAVRTLYRKDAVAQPTTPSRSGSASPARPAPAPQPSSPPAAGGAPEEPDYLRAAFSAAGEPDAPARLVSSVDSDQCPVHHRPWKVNSKGKFCSGKTPDGGWCQERPGRAA